MSRSQPSEAEAASQQEAGRLYDASATGDLLTVRDWLRWGGSRFNAAGLSYGQGTGSAVDEAAFLILETLGLPIDTLEPWLDCRLTAIERAAVRDILVRRVETRKPASYLTGTAYLQGHRFAVDENVIVPRSYIGELINGGGLDDLVPEPAGPEPTGPEPTGSGTAGFESAGGVRILDLCTGSGCLAILAALRFERAHVDAVELSAGALAVAARNVADYGLADRVSLLQGDLWAPLAGQRYDLIIANPPYVAAAEVAAFPEEHAAEPVMAHLGGDDGLDIARRILAGASGHLTEGGTLVMEIGTGREIIERDYPKLPLLWLDTEESEGEVLQIDAAQLAGAGRRSAGKKR